jgi:hypothetical protein
MRLHEPVVPRISTGQLFTIEEVAACFRVRRRPLQEHLRRYPYYSVLDRRKITTVSFTEGGW